MAEEVPYTKRTPASNVVLVDPDTLQPYAAGLAVPQYQVGSTTFKNQTQPRLTSRLVASAASVNATLVKSSAGDLFKIVGFNTNAAVRYLKIYNKATAPVVGTDFPSATITLEAQAPFEITFPIPLYLSAGIGFGITVNAADADTTAIGAGDITTMNLFYA